jgi:hypothetical protein
MRLQGIQDMNAVTGAELDAYVDLLRANDGGQAFLQIMRGFERTREKRELYRSVLRDRPYPVRIIWGSERPRPEARDLRRARTSRGGPSADPHIPRQALPPRGPGARNRRAHLAHGSRLSGARSADTGPLIGHGRGVRRVRTEIPEAIR